MVYTSGPFVVCEKTRVKIFLTSKIIKKLLSLRIQLFYRFFGIGKSDFV